MIVSSRPPASGPARHCAAIVLAGAVLLIAQSLAGEVALEDPYLWLEPTESPRVDAWVEKQNEITRKELASDPLFADLYQDARAVLNSPVRIPQISQKGAYLYDLWQDPGNPRGLYRRTTPEGLAHEPTAWETVMDIDGLARIEEEPWTFDRMNCLPDDDAHCLVFLARGGTDATVMREYDARSLTFVNDGFALPDAKMSVTWLDADRLLVATDFGEDSMTHSGYPRSLRLWSRGTPLRAAEELFSTPQDSVSVAGLRMDGRAGPLFLVAHNLTFWRTRYYHLDGLKLIPLDLPPLAEIVGALDGRLIVWLHGDWAYRGRSYGAGEVLAASVQLLEGGGGDPERIVASAGDGGITEVAVTAAGVMVNRLEDVISHLYRYRRGENGVWGGEEIVLPGPGAIKVASSDSRSALFYVTHEGFLSPRSLWQVDAESATAKRARQQSAQFEAGRFEVEQAFARSDDGTRVPYFTVMEKGTPRDGSRPVQMFAYGGFRISLTPSYSGTYEDLDGAYGKLWLERGGVFVSANIRGGSEYGPAWHEAALRENRVRAFEDFEAVARDLVRRRITSPAHLGIEGRSNGGLLVASTMIRHPGLYGAVICGVPLLDMRRYQLIGAGASWIAEYGNPEIPGDWAFISRYSPYQNVRADVHYPPLLVYSSTLDDRVHPAHGRKMVARMQAMGQRVYYYENREGGHHGNATNDQLAYRVALAYTLLWRTLR